MRGSQEWGGRWRSCRSPTCGHRGSPFQQQLEAVELVVEGSTVKGAVAISSLGIQVTTAGVGGSGR